MISYVKRKDIDVVKYNACIENSIQSRIYAFSWYLDIVAENWDVLVLNDYEAVMPIPWKRKFGVKYVAQPPFCQQLGIFSLQEFNETKERLFLKKVKRIFLKINYAFNADNLKNNNKNIRINYVLPLNNDYEFLFKGFNKGRKHAVKKSIKNNLSLGTISVKQILKLHKENYHYEGFRSQILVKLIPTLLEIEKAEMLAVYQHEKLLGATVFLKDENRIYYLFAAFNNLGKSLQAPSFVINKIISAYAKSNLLLDFEGGNITSIGRFFKSFGSKKTIYHVCKTNIFKKIFFSLVANKR